MRLSCSGTSKRLKSSPAVSVNEPPNPRKVWYRMLVFTVTTFTPGIIGRADPVERRGPNSKLGCFVSRSPVCLSTPFRGSMVRATFTSDLPRFDAGHPGGRYTPQPSRPLTPAWLADGALPASRDTGSRAVATEASSCFWLGRITGPFSCLGMLSGPGKTDADLVNPSWGCARAIGDSLEMASSATPAASGALSNTISWTSSSNCCTSS
mmetsp:Transcript_16277/g.34338  ORF Transcript_16277/g.34338 Transcript_16277/m.34338 type:complete len:209 (+) Transcript_16277:303-929(+)